MTPQQFVAQWTAPAQQAGAQLGLPWQWVLAQWGLESGYGSAAPSTPAAANLQNNNPADLGGPGAWQSFPTPASFVSAYVSTIRQDYGSSWAGLSGTGLGIGQVLGAGQASGRSYYGAQTPASYGSALASSLQQLVQITGQDLPVSLTAAEAAALGTAAPTAQPAGTNNPFSILPPSAPNLSGGFQAVPSYGQTVAGSVAGGTAGTSAAPVGTGWVSRLETWIGHGAALAGTIALGVVLLVVGLLLVARASAGDLESGAIRAAVGGLKSVG